MIITLIRNYVRSWILWAWFLFISILASEASERVPKLESVNKREKNVVDENERIRDEINVENKTRKRIKNDYKNHHLNNCDGSIERDNEKFEESTKIVCVTPELVLEVENDETDFVDSDENFIVGSLKVDPRKRNTTALVEVVGDKYRESKEFFNCVEPDTETGLTRYSGVENLLDHAAAVRSKLDTLTSTGTLPKTVNRNTLIGSKNLPNNRNSSPRRELSRKSPGRHSDKISNEQLWQELVAQYSPETNIESTNKLTDSKQSYDDTELLYPYSYDIEDEEFRKSSERLVDENVDKQAQLSLYLSRLDENEELALNGNEKVYSNPNKTLEENVEGVSRSNVTGQVLIIIESDSLDRGESLDEPNYANEISSQTLNGKVQKISEIHLFEPEKLSEQNQPMVQEENVVHLVDSSSPAGDRKSERKVDDFLEESPVLEISDSEFESENYFTSTYNELNEKSTNVQEISQEERLSDIIEYDESFKDEENDVERIKEAITSCFNATENKFKADKVSKIIETENLKDVHSVDLAEMKQENSLMDIASLRSFSQESDKVINENFDNFPVPPEWTNVCSLLTTSEQSLVARIVNHDENETFSMSNERAKNSGNSSGEQNLIYDQNGCKIGAYFNTFTQSISESCTDLENLTNLEDECSKFRLSSTSINDEEIDIYSNLDDVKDLLVPKTKRTRAKNYSIELNKLLNEDGGNGTQSPTHDESFKESNRSFEEFQEQYDIYKIEYKKAQMAELEKYLTMSDALTIEEQIELEEILCEQETNKFINEVSEARLEEILLEARKRIESKTDIDDIKLEAYLELPPSLTKEEEDLLNLPCNSVREESNEESYRKLIEQNFLEELEKDVLNIQYGELSEGRSSENFGVSDTSTPELDTKDQACGTSDLKKKKGIFSSLSFRKTSKEDVAGKELTVDKLSSENKKQNKKFFRYGSLSVKRKKKREYGIKKCYSDSQFDQDLRFIPCNSFENDGKCLSLPLLYSSNKVSSSENLTNLNIGSCSSKFDKSDELNSGTLSLYDADKFSLLSRSISIRSSETGRSISEGWEVIGCLDVEDEKSTRIKNVKLSDEILLLSIDDFEMSRKAKPTINIKETSIIASESVKIIEKIVNVSTDKTRLDNDKSIKINDKMRLEDNKKTKITDKAWPEDNKKAKLDEFQKMEQDLKMEVESEKKKKSESGKRKKKKKLDSQKENKKSTFEEKSSATEKHVGPRVRSFDTAKMKSKFNKPKESQQVSTECRICGQQVFQMEKIVAEKASWHKACFKCTECGKVLNLETYQSHEGALYCKPHFKELFRPKVVPQDEDAERKERLLRKPRMIVLESQPQALPDDVVRATAKPDYGLEELQQTLNVKKRFEMFENYQDEETPTLESVPVKRSQSLLHKAARFMGGDLGEEMNGEGVEEIVESEEDGEEGDDQIIKSNKKKERPMSFSGMGDLKAAWEQKQRREEMSQSRKEEVSRFRQLLCAGKNISLKEKFESGNFDETDEEKSHKEEIKIDGPRMASNLKKRFEQGQPFIIEEENGELNGFENGTHHVSEIEEVQEIFKDAETAKKARNVFKQIDSKIAQEGTAVMRSPSAVLSAPLIKDNNRIYTEGPPSAEIIKSGDKNDDFQVNTTDLASRFKFFTNYEKDLEENKDKNKKVFRITPPRDGIDATDQVQDELLTKSLPKPCMAVNCVACSVRRTGDISEREYLGRDPNLIKCSDNYEDEVDCRNTKNILNMFKKMEMANEDSDQEEGPKPLKCFTPPLDAGDYDSTGSDYTEEDYSTSEDEDPQTNALKDEILQMSAKKAANLREKFEKWENEENKEIPKDRSIENEEECMPSLDTAKNLKAMFEHKANEIVKPIASKPSSQKVNRFVGGGGVGACANCGKTVYTMEKLEIHGNILHRSCFKCFKCGSTLSMGSLAIGGNKMYCTIHYKQIFAERGTYDVFSPQTGKWTRKSDNNLEIDEQD